MAYQVSWLPRSALALVLFAAACSAAQATTPVFFTDFDGSLPAAVNPGTASLTSVSGFAGYGPVGNQFGGNFLRSATGNIVTLSLSGLQAHSAISVGFLFAAIDSLDGTGTFPQGDYFKVSLDGVPLFRESFANATLSQIQSYVAPSGVELARHVDMGFGGPGSYYTDSAYNLGADATFANIAHTAPTAVFTFQIEGVGNQTLDDESWAMDNLRVSVTAVPEPESYALMVAGLGMIGLASRRRKQPTALR
jgi:PEP-CTERM motif